MTWLVLLAVLAATAATIFGIVTVGRALHAPEGGAAGPRQARRLVFGVGLSLAAITSACLVAGLVYGLPDLVTIALIIGLEEAWEWAMLTGLLRRAEAVELAAAT